jgi:hypothetical protein
MVCLEPCQRSQQLYRPLPLATALSEHLPLALPVPLWELLPLHHIRVGTKLPEHYRVGHLKGVRGLCLPKLPFFFYSFRLVCNYIYLATSVRLGEKDTFLLFVLNSRHQKRKWQEMTKDDWNTSNKVIAAPNIGAKVGWFRKSRTRINGYNDRRVQHTQNWESGSNF